MSKQKRRRKWSPAQKFRMVLEALQSDGKLAAICRREGLSPTMVHQWRKQLLRSADAVFASKRKAGQDPKLERLESENQRMKNVIAETEGDQSGSLKAENLDLKKRSRIERPPAAPAGVAERGDDLGRADPTTQPLAGATDPQGLGDSSGQLLPLAHSRGLGEAATPVADRFHVRAVGLGTSDPHRLRPEAPAGPPPRIGLE